MFCALARHRTRAPAVGTELSLIDAIPNSGRYDGTVGVSGAFGAIRREHQDFSREIDRTPPLYFRRTDTVQVSKGARVSYYLARYLQGE